MKQEWVRVEDCTVERARNLLAAPGRPIWVRWYRTFAGGNNGMPWGRTRLYETGELVGVTAKRLKLKLRAGGVHTVDPCACYFAVRKEQP